MSAPKIEAVGFRTGFASSQMRVTIWNRALSDGSKVYSVGITDDDGQTAEIHCVSEKHANRLYIALCQELSEATGMGSVGKGGGK